MDESYFREKLSAYLDRSLSPEEMAMMDKYVAESEEARRVLAGFEKLNELVEKHSGLGESDYWERSARRIEAAFGSGGGTKMADIRPEKRTGLLWKITAVAASVVLLVFIGVHQWDILQHQENQEISPAIKEGGKLTPAEAESTTVFDLRSTEESEAGEGTPVQNEIAPGPKVDEELNELDNAGGVPAQSATKPSPEHAAQAVPSAQPSPTPEKQAAERPNVVESYTGPDTSQHVDLGKSIIVPSVQGPGSNNLPGSDTMMVRAERAGESAYAAPSKKTPTIVANEAAVSDAAILADKAEATGDTAYVIPEKLTAYQRDSLLAIFRAEREQFAERPKVTAPNTGAPSLTQGLQEQRKEKTVKTAPPTAAGNIIVAAGDQKKMLTAAYVVAMLSADNTERVEATDYIRTIAADTSAVHRALAEQYLEELKAKQVHQKR